MSDSNIVEYDSKRKFRLTLSDLAKVFNVPVPVVRSYVNKGLPHQKKGELYYFDLRESVAWWREYSSQQLKEYKSGRASQQNFLRELIDGRDILDKLLEIDIELEDIYTEVRELGEKFEGANKHLLEVKGHLDPGKVEVAEMLVGNKEKVLNARVRVLESRRSGLEAMLKKKLPDLRAIEIGKTAEGEDEIKGALALFAEAASK